MTLPPPGATLPRHGRPIGADISRRPGWSATTLWQSSYLAAGQAAQAAPIGTDIAPPGRRPLPGQSEQQPTNAHLVDLAAGGCRPDRRRTWGENVRTCVQTAPGLCAARFARRQREPLARMSAPQYGLHHF